MKQRITYFRHTSDDFDPERIEVTKDHVSLRSLKASKEHRITIGLSELPDQLTEVLNQCHELHIRWASPKPYAPHPVLASGLSLGLHVFLIPQEAADLTTLCPSLQQIFSEDLKCSTPKYTFTHPPILSTRFSATTSSQYYSPHVLSLGDFIIYIQQAVCPDQHQTCQESAFSLLTASHLDVDYDAISHALVLTASWSQSPSSEGVWNDKIVKEKDDKVEVGVLNLEKVIAEEEIRLGGWLTVIGEDTKPSPTLFSFPSRHHSLATVKNQDDAPTFFTNYQTPTGLHPTLLLYIRNIYDINAPIHRPQSLGTESHCALHAYITLPSYLFLDRHAFTDPLFLQSHNLTALRALSGATDLEAPDWSVPEWGSAILLELPTASISSLDKEGNIGSKELQVQVPLHLRYLQPEEGGYTNVTTPYPTVFWACKGEKGSKFSTNPFDRRNLGYDGLFGERTLFYHLTPQPPPQDERDRLGSDVGIVKGGNDEALLLMNRLRVPVLNSTNAWYVESATVMFVLAGFAWLVWCLIGPSLRSNSALKARSKNDIGGGKGKKNK